MATPKSAPRGQPADADEAPREGLFPMRIVTRLTGLNADTIRAWERRHRAIAPPRSDGNTRLFTHEDIERLTLLKEVVGLGHPIGQVAQLATLALRQMRDLERHRRDGPTADDGLDTIRREYIEAISRFDARRGAELLNQAAAHLPAREFTFRVALPILREVGERWSHTAQVKRDRSLAALASPGCDAALATRSRLEGGDGDPASRNSFGIAHEHLASTQIRAVLVTYLRHTLVDRGAPRVVLTTPEGHRHEHGILIAALLAQLRGFEVVYLGVDLPVDDIVRATTRANALLVILGVAFPLTCQDGEHLERLAAELPERTELWLGHGPTETFAHPRIRRITSFEQLELALAEKRG